MSKAERRARIKAQNAGKKVEHLSVQANDRVEIGGTRNSTKKKMIKQEEALEKAQAKAEKISAQWEFV